jgi:hypothetical protein
MVDDRRIQPCRWMGLTLFLPYPHWIAAEQDPWCCLRDQVPRPLDTTDQCHTCPRWEPKPDDRALVRL